MVSAFIKVAFSLLCGGATYAGWLAAFLLSARWDGPIVQALRWLSAPAATAVGFATGVAICEHLARVRRPGFFRLLVWPLVGCAAGAGVVYWFGPMLIVFGMFAAGTASIILREVALGIRKDESPTGSDVGNGDR